MKYFITRIVVVVAAIFFFEINAYSRLISLSVTYDYPRISNRLKALNEDVPPEIMSSVSDLVSDMAAGKLDKEVFEEKITEKAKIINQARDQRSKSLQVATLVGSGVAGLTFGLVSDVAIGDAVNPAILPTIGAAILSGGAYYVQSVESSSPVQPLLLQYIGGPTLSAGESISKSIKNAISKQQQAVNKKKEDTVDYIESIPTRIQDNIKSSIENAKKQALAKVDNTNKQIANIPNAIAQYFVKLADDTKASINRKTQETVAEIQATPQRVAEKITNAFDALIQRVKAIPGQAAQQVTDAVDAKTKEVKKVLDQKVSNVQSSVIKAVPKAPNVSISLPAIKLPEVKLPAVSLAAKASPTTPTAAKAETKPAPAQPAAIVQTKAPVEQEKTTPSIHLPKALFPTQSERPVVAPQTSVSPVVTANPRPAPAPASSKATSIKPAPAASTSKVSSVPSNTVFGSLFGGRGSSSPVKAVSKTTPAVVTAAAPAVPKEAPPKPISSSAPKAVAAPNANKGLFSFGATSKSSTPSKPVEKVPSAIVAKPAAVVPPKPAPTADSASSGLFSFGSKAKSPPSPNKAVPSPVVEPKAATPVTPQKSLFSFGSTSSTKTAASRVVEKTSPVPAEASKPTLLSTAAIKTLKSIKANEAAIAKIDTYLQTFSKGGVSAEKLYAQVADALEGNKSNAFAILPDLVGCLPKGTAAKQSLNSFYQQKAFLNHSSCN